MVIDENAAFQVLRALPTLDDARRERAARMLRDYEGQQERLGLPLWPSRVQELSKRRERMRSVFDNPLVLDQENGAFAVAESVVKGSGERMRKREANILWLSNRYQADEADVRARYDFYKADAGAKWGTGTLDDEQFFAKAKGEIEAEREAQKRARTARELAIHSALSGNSRLSELSRWQQFLSDDVSRRAWDATFDEFDTVLAPRRELIERGTAALQRWSRGEAGDEDRATMDGLIDEIANAEGRERAILSQALVMAAERLGRGDGDEGKRGVVGTFTGAAADLLERMFVEGSARRQGNLTQIDPKRIPFDGAIDSPEKAAAAVERALSLRDRADAEARQAIEFGPLPASDLDNQRYRDTKPEEQALLSEAIAKENRRIQAAREVKNLARSTDPFDDSIPGVMASGTASTLTLALPLALGPAGVAMAGLGYANMETEQLLLENPDMDVGAAQMIGLGSGAVQAAMDKATLFGLGKLAPNVRGIVTGQAKRAAAWTAGKQGVALFGFENAVEAMQDLSTPVLQTLAAELSQSVPGVDWKREMDEFWQSRADVALGMLPLMLIGAGVNTARNRRNVLDLLSSNQSLGEAGFVEADRVTILEATARGDVEGAQASVQAAMDRRSPEVAAEFNADSALTREKVEADAFMARRLEDMQRRGEVPVVRYDSQSGVWTVRDQAGNTVTAQSREEAVDLAYSALDEQDRIAAESTLQLFEELGGGQVAEVRAQSATGQSLTDEGILSVDEVLRGVATRAALDGLSPAEAREMQRAIFGFNRVEVVEGIRRGVSRLFNADPLTAVHETIHDNWRKLLASGRYTHAHGVRWVRMAEQLTGQKFLPENMADEAVTPEVLDEALAHVGQVEVLGRRKDKVGRFTPGLVSRGMAAFIRGKRNLTLGKTRDARALSRVGGDASAFKAFLDHFKAGFKLMLQAARALKRARAEGKVSEDYDEFLFDLLGADGQQRFEAQAAQEAAAMVGEIDNVPFSLAPRITPAQDAEYLAAVQAGDLETAQRIADEISLKVNGWKAKKRTDFSIDELTPSQKTEVEEIAENQDEIVVGLNLDRPPIIIAGEAPLYKKTVADGFWRLAQLVAGGNDGTIPAIILSGPKAYEFKQKIADYGKDVSDEYAPVYDAAAPVTYDDNGNIIPLSQRFNESTPDTRFSLAPRSLASVADTVLASRMRKPEFREALLKEARRRLDAIRQDGPLRVDGRGRVWQRRGQDSRADAIRSAANIEAERKFRMRSRQRELLDAGMTELSPAEIEAYEKGTSQWRDNDRLRSIFENGRLMSKTVATKRGSYDPAKHGDYDAAPGWLPPAMYAKDGGLMPDQMAQLAFDSGLISEPSPDALWEAIKSELDTLTKDNEAARAAQQKVREAEKSAAKQAKEEADAWAKEEKAKVPTPKERQLAALRTLDAILSAFPAEIRGQVGGFVQLAKLGTDKAREEEISRRLDKLDKVVEKAAKKHYLERIEKVFDKAKPTKGKAGEKPKGKLGAATQALVDRAKAFAELDEAGVSAKRAAIADRLAKATDPGTIADLVEREQLLDLFGALDERTSAELEAAAEWLADTYQTGRNRWRAVIEQREQEAADNREQARADIGKQGLDAEQQDALKQAKKIKKATGGMALSWLSFEQVMTTMLGRKSKLARDTVAAARAATNQKTDAMRAKRKEFRDTMAAIFNTPRQKVWQDRLWQLSQIGGVKVTKLEGARTETRTVAAEAVKRIIEGTATAKAFGLDALKLDKLAEAWADNEALPANRRKKDLAFDVPIAGTPTETELSELQAVHLSMMARQTAYTEVLALHGWTAEVMDSIEKQLSAEAKAIRDWLAAQYRDGWQPLNAVYARMYGVNLPRIQNYAPGTFEAMDLQGQDADPYGQGLLSEGGFKAGMLKTRGKHQAAPRLEDALSVYWGHVNATEHFKAFAEFARDLRGVMNNADVRKSIKAKGGADLLEAGQRWIEAFERNGLAARSASSRWDEFLRRRQASQAYLALAYNMGTLMKQSTAALGALLNMSPGRAARQFAKLITGQLDLGASYRSEVIQRRLDAGYSPEVRQAMAAMMAERPSWGTGFVQKGMEIIGMVDAIFTTASYAMAYDAHLADARAAGLTPEQARAQAEREAEATVARTAQPSEMMDRSLFEMGLQPTGKFLFLFASEARQKAALALEAYSPSSGLSKGERATRLLLLHVVFPLAIQTITNFWRDARDDDDEELFDSDNWRAGDYAKSMILGPALGLPLIGQGLNAALTPIFGGHFFANDPTQPLTRAIGGGEDIIEAIREGDLESGLKGMRSLMWALALAMGGERAAAVGAGTNILYDAFRVTENLGD